MYPLFKPDFFQAQSELFFCRVKTTAPPSEAPLPPLPLHNTPPSFDESQRVGPVLLVLEEVCGYYIVVNGLHAR